MLPLILLLLPEPASFGDASTPFTMRLSVELAAIVPVPDVALALSLSFLEARFRGEAIFRAGVALGLVGDAERRLRERDDIFDMGSSYRGGDEIWCSFVVPRSMGSGSSSASIHMRIP